MELDHPSRLRRTALAILCALSATSCSIAGRPISLGFFANVDRVDYAVYEERYGLDLSQQAVPADAKAIGLVVAQQEGLYLLGAIPLIRASLDQCIDRIANQARHLGADGVAGLNPDFDPAVFLTFKSFPLQWSAKVSVKGVAYRRVSSDLASHRASASVYDGPGSLLTGVTIDSPPRR